LDAPESAGVIRAFVRALTQLTFVILAPAKNSPIVSKSDRVEGTAGDRGDSRKSSH
jgi:hypothetical protein